MRATVVEVEGDAAILPVVLDLGGAAPIGDNAAADRLELGGEVGAREGEKEGNEQGREQVRGRERKGRARCPPYPPRQWQGGMGTGGGGGMAPVAMVATVTTIF